MPRLGEPFREDPARHPRIHPTEEIRLAWLASGSPSPVSAWGS